ncbi:sensor histidine kinase [Neobacillus fumarioli]|uniref:sensor histidine kinase n=1 Tax=Neobacillus fumarioli TaxID=105229 RepID=UPI00082FA5BC|nr:HAMP domain-containing sensor histidine kinase [Neobacillus fumarioli]
MKITNKINLLTTVWIICILMFINIVVFFLFMKTTVKMEANMMFQQAEDIIKDIRGNTSNHIENELKDYLTSHSYIRMILPNGKTAYEVTNDKFLAEKIKGKFAEEKQADNRMVTINHQEKQVLIIRTPIKQGGQMKGSLEIGEELLGLESRKDILLWILSLCTVLAVILSLLGGRWLSGIIMRPISNMIKTMEDIEQSGVLKKINIQIETKDELETMAKTFNRMIDRLQANMEKQSQFVSDASHELKTPLTIIKSYANLLRRHGLKNKEMANEAIEAIHSEATRIQKMTEHFLDLASLEKDAALEISEVNLISLCQDIQKQMKEAYKREILLQYRDPIILKADELKIKQVIIILLDNAIKYSSSIIEMFLERNEYQIIIRVKDYGIGIPQEEIENIFERFYRVDKARSRETGGSGLGLHIAKRIIKLHKGDITISSKEGVGTEVSIYLPIDR